jgi:hypothetical protein
MTGVKNPRRSEGFEGLGRVAALFCRARFSRFCAVSEDDVGGNVIG